MELKRKYFRFLHRCKKVVEKTYPDGIRLKFDNRQITVAHSKPHEHMILIKTLDPTITTAPVGWKSKHGVSHLWFYMTDEAIEALYHNLEYYLTLKLDD